MGAAPRRQAAATGVLHVRVVGAESSEPGQAELRRLFSHRTLTRSRRELLMRCTKVIAAVGSRVMGLAAFDHQGDDIRVHEIAVEPDLCFGAQDILRQLLDALELACLASGGRRLLLLPAAVVAVSPLERLGYHLVTEGCRDAWLEKRFL